MCAKIVFLAILALATAANTCSQSDVQGIAQCYSTSLATYGLQVSNGTNLPPYDVYLKARVQYLNAGYKNALAPMCNNQNALKKCLGNYSCFNRDTYLAMGQTPAQTYQYWADLAEYDFACGAGYNVLQQQFYCLKSVEQHSAYLLQQCDDALQAQLKNGTETCAAFNQYLKCMYTVYYHGCANNAGSYICQEIRAGFNSYDLPCELNGKLNTCPPFIGTNPKMEAITEFSFKNRLF